VITEQLRNTIETICSSYETHVVECVSRGSKNRPIIEIFVDASDFVSFSTCTSISREVEELLEESSDFTATNYLLEVSSPGVDRPLQYQWQYPKYTNKLCQVHLIQETEGTTILQGRLEAVSDEAITLIPAKIKDKSKNIKGKKPKTKKAKTLDEITEVISPDGVQETEVKVEAAPKVVDSSTDILFDHILHSHILIEW
jgi:ribosome maturation factor RimP